MFTADVVEINLLLSMIAFGAVCHNNVVSFFLRFEPPDLLVTHKLASHVSSYLSEFQIKL